MKRFLFVAFVVVAALSLGACTGTNNQVASREKATKLTCAGVNSAIANQRTDTPAQWSDTIQSIVANAKRSDNASLLEAASRDVAPVHWGQRQWNGIGDTSIDLVGLLRTCDSLGLGATF